MAIFSNPLFATYSVYARNASIVIRHSRVENLLSNGATCAIQESVNLTSGKHNKPSQKCQSNFQLLVNWPISNSTRGTWLSMNASCCARSILRPWVENH